MQKRAYRFLAGLTLMLALFAGFLGTRCLTEQTFGAFERGKCFALAGFGLFSVLIVFLAFVLLRHFSTTNNHGHNPSKKTTATVKRRTGARPATAIPAWAGMEKI